jgi:hypothetical protein
MLTKYPHTTWIVYVRPVTFTNATNTTTSTSLLFLLSFYDLTSATIGVTLSVGVMIVNNEF